MWDCVSKHDLDVCLWVLGLLEFSGEDSSIFVFRTNLVYWSGILDDLTSCISGYVEDEVVGVKVKLFDDLVFDVSHRPVPWSFERDLQFVHSDIVLEEGYLDSFGRTIGDWKGAH